MQKNEIRSKVVRWYEWILPAIIILVAVIWGVWALKNPSDSIVRNYLTPDRLVTALLTHLFLIAVSASLAVLTSVPLGMLLTRPSFRWLCGPLVAVINICQTIPSFAVVAIMFSLLGIGAKTAIFALWVYSLLPILNNTIAGIRGVSPFVIDSATGMGMTKAQVLLKIELPLAMPVIFAGIRTAVVINVATAIIAAFVGAGGLGDLIVAGKNISRYQVMLLGAGYASLMALLFDSLLGMVEKKLTGAE